jgi:WD40 repeat protein
MGTKINKSIKSDCILKERKNQLKENDYLYNNFDINQKKLILEINYHKAEIFRLCLLDDGRLVSSSYDTNIIIYNKITYRPDIIIKEHKDFVYDIIEIDPNILASCSGDKTIKIFKIKDNNYKILQTLNYHKNNVYRLLQLKNSNLVSSSYDKTIIFYSKDINNNKYTKYYKILTHELFLSVVQTKDNEISYPENYKIHFFDLKKKKNYIINI